MGRRDGANGLSSCRRSDPRPDLRSQRRPRGAARTGRGADRGRGTGRRPRRNGSREGPRGKGELTESVGLIIRSRRLGSCIPQTPGRRRRRRTAAGVPDQVTDPRTSLLAQRSEAGATGGRRRTARRETANVRAARRSGPPRLPVAVVPLGAYLVDQRADLSYAAAADAPQSLGRRTSQAASRSSRARGGVRPLVRKICDGIVAIPRLCPNRSTPVAAAVLQNWRGGSALTPKDLRRIPATQCGEAGRPRWSCARLTCTGSTATPPTPAASTTPRTLRHRRRASSCCRVRGRRRLRRRGAEQILGARRAFCA